jgi:type VI secretion system protein ImpL
MRQFFSWIFSRQMLIFLGVLLVAGLIWFVGPLISIAEYAPLEPVWVRWTLIGVVFAWWLLALLIRWWRSRRVNERLLDQLARMQARPASTDKSGDGAAAVGELRARFVSALEILKKARIEGTETGSWWSHLTRRYIYQLPWYMFIGTPGSGKTTALINSGLSFPLADQFGKAAIRGVGGTRSCDWWFTNEAVLLDTAGRYTTQDSNESVDLAEWTGFLNLLKKFRPRQPINGVLLTLSVSDLLTGDRNARQAISVNFKKRLAELRDAFGISFPVYVLVTKLDLISGFSEYFAGLDKEERSQVWGFTFPYTPNPDARNSPLSGGFRQASASYFADLNTRINAALPEVLLHEPNLSRRALIYAMPQQFAGLSDLIGEVLDPLFADSMFAEAALLRGVYFTSGTQEGTPFDRVFGAMQARFGVTASVRAASSPGTGKSFFLLRLMREVIFNESHLAGRNWRWEKRQRILRVLGMAAIGIGLFGLAGAWFWSYGGNRDYIAEVEASAEVFSKDINANPAIARIEIAQLLPILDRAEGLNASKKFDVAAPPLGVRWGLYQGPKIKAATHMAYDRMLEEAFWPRVARRIETVLREAPADNLEYGYEALKAYLMMFDSAHFDAGGFKSWAVVDWEKSAADPEMRVRFEHHLSRLAESRVPAAPFKIDENLVKTVRDRLEQLTPAQRAYSRLKRRLGGHREFPDFTLSGAAGAQAPLTFVRMSGKPLTSGIPGMFTMRGYRDGFESEARDVATLFNNEDSWVLGGGASSTKQLAKEAISGRGIQEIRRLYFTDYAKTWDEFLTDIKLAPSTSITQSVQLARVLSAADSPLALLVRAVARETTFSTQGTDDNSLLKQAKDRVRATKDDLARIVGTNDLISNNSPTERPESIVEIRFEGIRRLAGSGGSGAAPIDETIKLLNELYTYLTATEVAVRAGNAPPASELPVKLKAESARLPQPLRQMIESLAYSGSAQSASAVRAGLGANLKAAVGDFCRTAIAGRYPLQRSATKEIAPDDFGRMFGPGGLMDEFFAKNLASMVDTTTRPWSFRRGIDGSAIGTAGSLNAFQRAATIRDVFFRGGRTASLRVDIKPVEVDPGITQFTLDIDGQILRYENGNKQPLAATWPGIKGVPQVRLTAQPSGSLIADGAWALHRFFDKTRISEGSSPERFTSTVMLDGRRIVFEVTAGSVQNPFHLTQLEGFACPAGL